MNTTFLGAIAGSALTGNVGISGAAHAQALRGSLKKSCYYSMFPEDLSIADKFSLAKRIGLDGIEIPTVENTDVVQEFGAASRKTGVAIHSIMNSDHWRHPFSSIDQADIKAGMKGMETSLHNARDLGADTVLLVPAVVNPETSYSDAYARSQKYIRELLPLASELKVIIAIENVWNKFLLSPVEFARYVDEFDSPWLKAYFDVGNIALYGYPHDWIRTLGKRIVKVHVKGFDTGNKEFVNIGDGTIDWIEARRALSDISYSGYVNAEIRGGDEAYLRNVCTRLDRFFEGKEI